MVDHNWQKINAGCHSCHSWQDHCGGMITAMTAFIIILVIAVAVSIQAIRLALHDGMSSTPPTSHFDDPQFHAPAAG